MQIFAGVNLVTQVNAAGVGVVQDRGPAAGKLVEGFLDQTSGALRPWVPLTPRSEIAA